MGFRNDNLFGYPFGWQTSCTGSARRQKSESDKPPNRTCKKKATVKQLQQLCGLLNFLGKAIFPGRSFTRRMYAKFSEIVNINGAPKSANDYKWKQHHHVKLDKEFKLDCTVWLRFLSSEICSVVCRPMVDLQKMDTSVDIGFASDASAAKDLGFGAILGHNWIYGIWPKNFID